MSKSLAVLVAALSLAALAAIVVSNGRKTSPPSPVASNSPRQPMVAQPGDGNADPAAAPEAADSLKTEPVSLPPHPLLREAADAVLAELPPEGVARADKPLVDVIRRIADSAPSDRPLPSLVVDYPLDESIFPPEIVAPTFLWHEPAAEADTWLWQFDFGSDTERIYVLVPGNPPPAGPIDTRCLTSTNEIYRGTEYQQSARSWTPGEPLWAAIKQRSTAEPCRVTVFGFASAAPSKAVSRGELRLRTSTDPVGAPIFYRDVPLAPSATQEGVIKPLSDAFLPLIGLRLRDIGKPESRLLLSGMLTCVNCHSFSDDGKTMGMDLDGPANDKGAYIIAPLAKETVIDNEHVISWNSFKEKPEGHKTIGFLSRLSPDGQYAVTTLNESVYVQNFTDYRFLQVFYPTRGILGYYSREDREIRVLPGADSPQYVHCDPVWSPDGQYLVFARAEARDAYPPGYKPAAHAGDPAEVPIQYDLYRMPFDSGRGGTPEPIAGASGNGMSNTFPKVSPDGRWIVFVKCRNGQLMRPDSELWIVPGAGGTARRMRANTSRMNSWHSFSPNSRWLVFSSKANTPYTQMFLTHIDEEGNDSPPILVPNSTAANRAVNIPEFVNVPYEEFASISVPATEYLHVGMRGIELFEQRKLDEAMVQFKEAVRLEPNYLEGHVSMAVILIEKGRIDEAVPLLEKALTLDPDCWFAHANLGLIRGQKGDLDGAIEHFQKAVAINPKHHGARMNLGQALANKGMLDEATVHFQAAVDLATEDAGSRINLGSVLLERGMLKEAVAQYEKAVQIAPDLLIARLGLGEALAQQGEFAAAVAQFRRARQADPNDLGAINGLAWLLATSPDDEVRSGKEAVELAKAACTATGSQDPLLLETLAAAYAEAGQWSEAIATATSAVTLAESQNPRLAAELRQHLANYRQQKPVRFVTSGAK